MHLRQVNYFLAIVDNNGLNAAAHALGIAQPTISQAIRDLERDLDVELFHRIGRGMVLTSAGQAFVGPARRLLRDVRTAEASLLDTAGRPRGRLDIVTTPALSADPVAALAGTFRQRFPTVTIRIGHLGVDTSIPAHIDEGHCELAVCHLPIPDNAALTVHELGMQNLWLVFPPGAPVPPNDPLALRDLPDVPYVTVPRATPQASEIETVLASEGRVIRQAAVLRQREARLPFVFAGVGATFLERSMAEAAAQRGAVVRATDPPISWSYGLVYDQQGLSPAGRAFVELATENARGATRQQHAETPRRPERASQSDTPHQLFA